MTRTAGAALRAHLDEILVVAVLAGAIVWFLNIEAATTSITQGLVQAPTALDSGADRRYLDDMTVALESAPVRRATAEATGLTVDQVISRLSAGPRIDGRIVQVEDRAVDHDPDLAGLVISSSVEAAHDIAIAPPTDEEVRRTIANLGERLDQAVELIGPSEVESAALVELDDELLEVRSALSQEQVAIEADAAVVDELAAQAGLAFGDALADPFVDDSDLSQSLVTARDDVRRIAAAVTTLDPDTQPSLDIGPTIEQESLDRPFGAAVLAGLTALAVASCAAIAWQFRADRKRDAKGDLQAYRSVSIDERLSDHLPEDTTA